MISAFDLHVPSPLPPHLWTAFHSAHWQWRPAEGLHFQTVQPTGVASCRGKFATLCVYFYGAVRWIERRAWGSECGLAIGLDMTVHQLRKLCAEKYLMLIGLRAGDDEVAFPRSCCLRLSTSYGSWQSHSKQRPASLACPLLLGMCPRRPDGDVGNGRALAFLAVLFHLLKCGARNVLKHSEIIALHRPC